MATLVLALLTMLLAGGTAAHAQGPTAEERASSPGLSVGEIERDVMCVTCGVPLSIADSPAADAQRREIQRLIDAGLGKREIEDRLIAIYGEEVLAEPRRPVLAYWVPALLVLAGAAAVMFAARRWRRRRGERAERARDEDDSVPVLSGEDAERVAADLARHPG